MEKQETMKSYTVILPIAGHITVNVEAENEQEAIEKAKYNAGEISTVGSSLLNNDIEEFLWEIYDKITEGNVRYYEHNEIEVECYDDYDEDNEINEE